MDYLNFSRQVGHRPGNIEHRQPSWESSEDELLVVRFSPVLVGQVILECDQQQYKTI